ncbi:MAG: hypothetical protein WD249_03650 [Gaiellaceae bacterium]
MLAYLFQEESELAGAWLAGLGLPVEGIAAWDVETQRSVPDGFCDLVLTAPGEAVFIVESKLGATTSYGQIAKYMHYLSDLPQPGPKGLIFTTQHHEALPAGVETEAPDVSVILCRWQLLARFLRGTESRLALDFVAMLENEGIVAPEPFTESDWEAWRRGGAVSRRLREFLDELEEPMQRLAAGYRKAGSTASLANGMIRRAFEFETFTVWVSFWPSRNPPRPHDHAFVNVYVADSTRPDEKRRAAARSAAELAGEKAIQFVSDWDQYALAHITPAQDVFAPGEYHEQRGQLVDHVSLVLDRFRELGYLPAASAGASSVPASGRLRQDGLTSPEGG